MRRGEIMCYISEYLYNVVSLSSILTEKENQKEVEKMVDIIASISKKGRLFIIGVGGGAGNANHAVNDFRKLAHIEAYAPTDNSSELTARVNDDGWDSVFVEWLKVSKLNRNDCVMVFSVGGGSISRNISGNIVKALEFAQKEQAKIVGIVGRDGGYTAKVADACIIVPTVEQTMVTPLTESFQSIIWHLIVTHPKLKETEMKWERTI